MDAVSLLRSATDGRTWQLVASVGRPRAGHTGRGRRRGRRSTTTWRWSCAGTPLPAGDQRVLAAFAAQVAVAYREQQLAEAARAAEPLAESDRQRTALLNAVSHDLRTPIASAKAAVSSLRAGEVAVVRRATATNCSPPPRTRSTGSPAWSPTCSTCPGCRWARCRSCPRPVGLDDVVARALDHVDRRRAGRRRRPRRPARGAGRRRPAGTGDRQRRAERAALHARPDARCASPAAATGDGVELRVIDRGPGIAAGSTEAVFRPFQRADDAPADGAGVGLGLAIARGFTEAMGGAVTAEPTPGGGATLVISLTAAAGMTRVLLVEDERALLRALAMNLVARGYAVTEADDRDARADRAGRRAARRDRARPRAARHVRRRRHPRRSARTRPRRSSCCRRAAAARTRSRRSTSAPTTTSPSRSAWTSCWPGCARPAGGWRAVDEPVTRDGRDGDGRPRR